MVWTSGLRSAYPNSRDREWEIELDKLERNPERQTLEVREYVELGTTVDITPMAEPVLTAVTINDQRTWVVKYQGDKAIVKSLFLVPQTIFFFPVIQPNNLYFEYSDPIGWRVFFLGRAKELLESKHKDSFPHLQKLTEDKIIIVMNSTACPKGCEGGNGLAEHFVGEVVMRVEDGQLIRPQTYFRYK